MNAISQTQDNSADHTRLVDMFEQSVDATRAGRLDSERYRDYYDGKQWTAEERAVLEKRKQPIITFNKICEKVNYMTGLEKQSRTDPRAFPRNPGDDDGQAAQAATDATRFVCDRTKFANASSDVFENMMIEGMGGVEIPVVDKRGEKVVEINRIAWDRIFYDPHSREYDFSDARYMGYITWMDYEEAAGKWPDSVAVLESTMNTVSVEHDDTDTYSDKPVKHVWADPKRKRVCIVQMYFKVNCVWHWAQFTRAGTLASGEVVYTDEYGDTVCPMELVSAFIDRDNDRYGTVRALISPQDETNKRRSKALHIVNTRQVIYEEGAVEDIDEAMREIAKPDGAVKVQPQYRFEIANTNDMAAQQFSLLQSSEAQLSLQGPNAAMAGKSEKSESGRAILAQQQGGMVEMTTVLDRHRQWKLRCYEAVWNRVRQFWDAPKWVRVTDDDQKPRFVGLNQPVTAGDVLLEQLQTQGWPEEVIQGRMQAAMVDPRFHQPVKVKNNVAEMHVDFEIDETPDMVTLRQEEFSELVKLASNGVPIPPDVLIEASSMPNKDKLLEKLKEGGQPNPMADAAGQLEIAAKEADVRETHAKANKLEAEAMQVNQPPPQYALQI